MQGLTRSTVCMCNNGLSTTLSTPSPLPHYPTTPPAPPTPPPPTNPTHTSMVKGSTKQCWHCKTKCLMSTIGACKPRRRCDTDTKSEGICTCVDWTFVIKASMAAAFNIPFDAAPMAAGTCDDDHEETQGRRRRKISALLNIQERPEAVFLQNVPGLCPIPRNCIFLILFEVYDENVSHDEGNSDL